MKVIITDNEPGTRSSVKELLVAFCPEVTAIEEAGGVQEGLQKIKSFHSCTAEGWGGGIKKPTPAPRAPACDTTRKYVAVHPAW